MELFLYILRWTATTWEDWLFIEEPEEAPPVGLREVGLRGADDGLLVYEVDERGAAAAQARSLLLQFSHVDLLSLVPAGRKQK